MPYPSAADADELEEILEAFPGVVVLVDRDRKITYLSRGAHGHSVEDVIGRPSADFMAPGSREEHVRALDGVFESGEPAAELTEVEGSDGEIRWYEGTMVPIVRGEQVVSVAVFTQDVTARVRSEEEVEMLRSLLPLCSWCKRVRTKEGEWQPLESYLEEASDSRITHGMCPECERTMKEGEEPHRGEEEGGPGEERNGGRGRSSA